MPEPRAPPGRVLQALRPLTGAAEYAWGDENVDIKIVGELRLKDGP